MAFVYRTINDDNSSTSFTPGPGAYFNSKKYKNQPQSQYSVPFNQSQSRQIWKTTVAPGPGTYQTQSTIKKQKKLASDPSGQIIIYQTPSQSVPFKSKTIRFVDGNNSSNPGPGEYQVHSLKPKPLSASKANNKSGSQLKQFLRKKNQAIQPQCQSSQLQKQIIISANADLSFVQENQSKQIDTIKSNKNSVFFASKVQRQINQIRPKTSLGPGSYNINKSSFKAQKNYEKKSPSKSICIDKKITKKQSQQLGPGYYEVDRAFKNLSQGNLIKKKKLECFGSTVDRFQIFKTDIKTIAPGPAYYEIETTETIKPLRKQTAKTTFPKQQRMIFNKPHIPISPITYQTETKFSQALKEKYKRKPSVKECFGSTKSRFQQKQTQFNQNSQNYHSSINLLLRNQKQNDFGLSQSDKIQKNTFKNLSKKNKQKRFFVSNESIEVQQNLVDWSSFRPFCYDTESNTLQAKYNKKVQKQAPFMSCAQRFKDNNSERYIDLGFDSKKSKQKPNLTQKMTGSYKSKSAQKSAGKKMGWMGVSKDSRFKYQQEKNKDLGPQYYDPVKPEKKSYNILFA